MSTSWPVISILCVYLLIVLKIGPYMIKNRKPMNPKYPICYASGLQRLARILRTFRYGFFHFAYLLNLSRLRVQQYGQALGFFNSAKLIWNMTPGVERKKKIYLYGKQCLGRSTRYRDVLNILNVFLDCLRNVERNMIFYDFCIKKKKKLYIILLE